MQDSQQTYKERLAYYLMYEVTVPRDYVNLERERAVEWAPRDVYEITSRAMIGVAADGYYESPIFITAVNGIYTIHPGNNRYLLNRVHHDMPPLKAVVVDRYGTSKEMIEDTFGPATLYTESMIGFWNFKNNPRKGTLGHTMKYKYTSNKNDWDIERTTTDVAFLGNDCILVCNYKGRQVAKVGIGSTVIEKDISCMTDFGKYVKEYFIDTD